MDQLSEALQLLKGIRDDIRIQTELTKRLHDENKIFREDALKLQKKVIAQQKRQMLGILLLCVFLGMAGSATMALIFAGHK